LAVGGLREHGRRQKKNKNERVRVIKRESNKIKYNVQQKIKQQIHFPLKSGRKIM
jgi:hypothetical protein